ncbi:MAG: class I SAM-dependent methyltransferase [Armatimonadota bacterium]|nr:class I SAM-dependent methyltransferase [Armatimonadota bacterium]
MEEEEQARAYAGTDFAEAHQAYVRLFGERFPDAPAQASALDIGCGPADVTRRFARAFSGWRVHALDGARAMLTEARQALASEPELAGRITLVEGVLPDAVLPRTHYDVVLSTSLLHHLHDPDVLWRAVRASAAPGATVFIADLSRPESAEAAQSLVAQYAVGAPSVLQRDFFNSLCAAFTPDEVREQLAVHDLGGLCVETVSDRHLIVWGRMP